MQKLVNLTPEENKKHIEMFGDFNDLPGVIVKSTEEECMKLMNMWVMTGTEFRQLRDFKFRNARLFFFSQESANFMIVDPGRHAPREFYKFHSKASCDHVFGPAVSKGRCYTESTCTKCGHVHAVDSSD